ncbi:MAG: ATP-binding cassette domain-containing protein [Patescibacteria group bacterium]
MSKQEVIIRFEGVSFEYSYTHPIVREVSFPVRRGAKIALMGQNGAGKSTLFGLITGTLKPDAGKIHIDRGSTIATARQVIPRAEMDMTVREFFQACFSKKIYDIDPRIDTVLEAVNLHVHSHTPIYDRKIKTLSGGQQARLLLASALIQNPDILLLDEPTNNLDHAGIEHLTKFLVEYKKTCIVISHDAEFLNAFTQGVLYLDIFTRTIEQYVGTYTDVQAEIAARIEKENIKNARLAKEIDAKKAQANVFAQKGGQMRVVAKRMREYAEELAEQKVDVRKEDKTIRSFIIPAGDTLGEILTLTAYSIMNPKTHKVVSHKTNIILKKRMHLLLSGPNGIGKTTLLESLANGTADGATIAPGITVGYYRQDFSTLNFNDTVHESLMSVMERQIEENLRSVAAGFLITSDMLRATVGSLSEGQKGLVAFARLVLQKPGLLILDEPTNHINFRHLPVIARALDQYEGAMVLVSHVPEFVSQIRIDEELRLDK